MNAMEVHSEDFYPPAYTSAPSERAKPSEEDQRASNLQVGHITGPDAHYFIDQMEKTDESGAFSSRQEPLNLRLMSPACPLSYTGKIANVSGVGYDADPLSVGRDEKAIAPYDSEVHPLRDPRKISSTVVVRTIGCKTPLAPEQQMDVARSVLHHMPNIYVKFLEEFVHNLCGRPMQEYFRKIETGLDALMSDATELNRTSWSAFASVAGFNPTDLNDTTTLTRLDANGLAVAIGAAHQQDVTSLQLGDNTMVMPRGVAKTLRTLSHDARSMTGQASSEDCFDLRPCLRQHIATAKYARETLCGQWPKERHLATLLVWANEMGRQWTDDLQLMSESDMPDYRQIRVVVPLDLSDKLKTESVSYTADGMRSPEVNGGSPAETLHYIDSLAYSVGEWCGTRSNVLFNEQLGSYNWGFGHCANVTYKVKVQPDQGPGGAPNEYFKANPYIKYDRNDATESDDELAARIVALPAGSTTYVGLDALLRTEVRDPALIAAANLPYWLPGGGGNGPLVAPLFTTSNIGGPINANLQSKLRYVFDTIIRPFILRQSRLHVSKTCAEGTRVYVQSKKTTGEHYIMSTSVDAEVIEEHRRLRESLRHSRTSGAGHTYRGVFDPSMAQPSIVNPGTFKPSQYDRPLQRQATSPRTGNMLVQRLVPEASSDPFLFYGHDIELKTGEPLPSKTIMALLGATCLPVWSAVEGSPYVDREKGYQTALSLDHFAPSGAFRSYDLQPTGKVVEWNMVHYLHQTIQKHVTELQNAALQNNMDEKYAQETNMIGDVQALLRMSSNKRMHALVNLCLTDQTFERRALVNAEADETTMRTRIDGQYVRVEPSSATCVARATTIVPPYSTPKLLRIVPFGPNEAIYNSDERMNLSLRIQSQGAYISWPEDHANFPMASPENNPSVYDEPNIASTQHGSISNYVGLDGSTDANFDKYTSSERIASLEGLDEATLTKLVQENDTFSFSEPRVCAALGKGDKRLGETILKLIFLKKKLSGDLGPVLAAIVGSTFLDRWISCKSNSRHAFLRHSGYWLADDREYDSQTCMSLAMGEEMIYHHARREELFPAPAQSVKRARMKPVLKWLHEFYGRDADMDSRSRPLWQSLMRTGGQPLDTDTIFDPERLDPESQDAMVSSVQPSEDGWVMHAIATQTDADHTQLQAGPYNENDGALDFPTNLIQIDRHYLFTQEEELRYDADSETSSYRAVPNSLPPNQVAGTPTAQLYLAQQQVPMPPSLPVSTPGANQHAQHNVYKSFSPEDPRNSSSAMYSRDASLAGMPYDSFGKGVEFPAKMMVVVFRNRTDDQRLDDIVAELGRFSHTSRQGHRLFFEEVDRKNQIPAIYANLERHVITLQLFVQYKGCEKEAVKDSEARRVYLRFMHDDMLANLKKLATQDPSKGADDKWAKHCKRYCAIKRDYGGLNVATMAGAKNEELSVDSLRVADSNWKDETMWEADGPGASSAVVKSGVLHAGTALHLEPKDTSDLLFRMRSQHILGPAFEARLPVDHRLLSGWCDFGLENAHAFYPYAFNHPDFKNAIKEFLPDVNKLSSIFDPRANFESDVFPERWSYTTYHNLMMGWNKWYYGKPEVNHQYPPRPGPNEAKSQVDDLFKSLFILALRERALDYIAVERIQNQFTTGANAVAAAQVPGNPQYIAGMPVNTEDALHNRPNILSVLTNLDATGQATDPLTNLQTNVRDAIVLAEQQYTTLSRDAKDNVALADAAQTQQARDQALRDAQDSARDAATTGRELESVLQAQRNLQLYCLLEDYRGVRNPAIPPSYILDSSRECIAKTEMADLLQTPDGLFGRSVTDARKRYSLRRGNSLRTLSDVVDSTKYHTYLSGCSGLDVMHDLLTTVGSSAHKSADAAVDAYASWIESKSREYLKPHNRAAALELCLWHIYTHRTDAVAKLARDCASIVRHGPLKKPDGLKKAEDIVASLSKKRKKSAIDLHATVATLMTGDEDRFRAVAADGQQTAAQLVAMQPNALQQQSANQEVIHFPLPPDRIVDTTLFSKGVATISQDQFLFRPLDNDHDMPTPFESDNANCNVNVSVFRPEFFAMLDAGALLWNARTFFNPADCAGRPVESNVGAPDEQHYWSRYMVESFLVARERYKRANKQMYEKMVKTDPEAAFPTRLIGAMCERSWKAYFPLLNKEHPMRDDLRRLRALNVFWGELPTYNSGRASMAGCTRGAWMPLSVAMQVDLLQRVQLFDQTYRVPLNPWAARADAGLSRVFNQSYHSVYHTDSYRAPHFREWATNMCRYQRPNANGTYYPFTQYGGTPVAADFTHHKVTRACESNPASTYWWKRLVYDRFGMTGPLPIGAMMFDDAGILQDLFSFEVRPQAKMEPQHKEHVHRYMQEEGKKTLHISNFLAYARVHCIMALASVVPSTTSISAPRAVRNFFRFFVDTYKFMGVDPEDDGVPCVMGFLPKEVTYKEDRPIVMYAGTLACVNDIVQEVVKRVPTFVATQDAHAPLFLNDATVLYTQLLRGERRLKIRKANYARALKVKPSLTYQDFLEVVAANQDVLVEFMQNTILSLMVETGVDVSKLPLHQLEPRTMRVDLTEHKDMLPNDFLIAGAQTSATEHYAVDNLSRTQLAQLALVPPGQRVLGTLHLAKPNARSVNMEYLRKEIEREIAASNKSRVDRTWNKMFRALLASRQLEADATPFDPGILLLHAQEDPRVEAKRRVSKHMTVKGRPGSASIAPERASEARRQTTPLLALKDAEMEKIVANVAQQIEERYAQKRREGYSLSKRACLRSLKHVPDNIKRIVEHKLGLGDDLGY